MANLDLAYQTQHQSDVQLLAKALLRAAAAFDLSQDELARIIGVSAPTVSRMVGGDCAALEKPKPFEHAALFLRLARSLLVMMGGEEESARAWLRGENRDLEGRPIELTFSSQGLVHVVDYLDSFRAPA